MNANPQPSEIAATLSPAMRRALRSRQEDLYADRAKVAGHGMTMRALRQRGLVVGAMPHAVVTPIGREVIEADPEIKGGPA